MLVLNFGRWFPKNNKALTFNKGNCVFLKELTLQLWPEYPHSRYRSAIPGYSIAFPSHTEYKARISNMKAILARSLAAFHVYMGWYKLYKEIQQNNR